MLDVACGTGIVGRIVRERCGASARIVGVDVNHDMIVKARSIAPDIEWLEGNAQQLPVKSGNFDVVLCQEGLQFFRDRVQAVKEMRRALTAGGRLAVSTWRPIEECPFFHVLQKQAVAQFGPIEDRRFSFGDDEAISRLLDEAGFQEINSTIVTLRERVSDPRTFIEMNLGATVDALDEMDAGERKRAIDRFEMAATETFARFSDGRGLVHPVSANVVTAVA